MWSPDERGLVETMSISVSSVVSRGVTFIGSRRLDSNQHVPAYKTGFWPFELLRRCLKNLYKLLSDCLVPRYLGYSGDPLCLVPVVQVRGLFMQHEAERELSCSAMFLM